MAVPSDGSYGVAEGIVYSFPVRCQGRPARKSSRTWRSSDFSREHMNATEAELLEERDGVKDLL